MKVYGYRQNVCLKVVLTDSDTLAMKYDVAKLLYSGCDVTKLLSTFSVNLTICYSLDPV